MLTMTRAPIRFGGILAVALLGSFLVGAGDKEPTLKPIAYEPFLKNIADSDAKITLVDCWASWCGPCKENYPHLKLMDQKYGKKGLRVLALSFDAGTSEPDIDKKEISAAEKFIAEQKATFENFRLAEERDLMFEKFDVSTIPAVFVYDANGKEIKRYTWDDPNHQFTYEQVEKDVAGLLSARP
jgi:thiol-disulfide isomerase/thioredoxin